MHGVQLIRYFAGVVLFFFLGTYFFLFPVQVLKVESKDLALAPFGYTYKGKEFSGVVYDFYPNSKISKLTFIYKGKRHGPDIQWHVNGQRFIEQHYHHGQEVGQHKAWYEDGSVKYFKNFREGLPHGEFYEWHNSGQLAQFVVYENGKELAAKSWTAGGKPFYNYVWYKDQTIGLRGDTFCSPVKKRL